MNTNELKSRFRRRDKEQKTQRQKGERERMEKQFHETVVAAHVEQAFGTQDSLPGNEKEKSHRHR